MNYLIAQIWLFIVAGSLVGVFFGWMFRGGMSAARLRELRRKLAHVQAEADDQRREAAEHAARAERRGAASATDISHIQAELREAKDRIGALQSELRSARTDAERHADEAAELRAQVAQLSGPRPAGPSQTSGSADDGAAAELAYLNSRVADLEGALEEARQHASGADPEEIETLRARIAELEAAAFAAAGADGESVESAQLGALRDQLASLRTQNEELRASLAAQEARATEVKEADARIAELEAALAAAQADAEAAAHEVQAGDGAQTAPDDIMVESERLKWRNGYLTSRIQFLETKLRAALRRRHAGAADEDGGEGDEEFAFGEGEDGEYAEEVSVEDELLIAARGEIERLNVRIAELEQAAAGDMSGEPAPNVDGGHGSVQWRNRYLASRVRYLEQQLAENPQSRDDAETAALREKLKAAEEAAAEASRLRAKVSELERAVEATKPEGEAGAKSENEYALEWRNRYLSSRVKYLEDRLAKAGLAQHPAEA
ncbi:MAG: hypothetical protein PVI23_08090 [Maricaulaceae bacterium]|jgi:hypothetical protein